MKSEEMDEETKKILVIVNSSNKPLDTNDVLEKFPKSTFSKVYFRLNLLGLESKIKHKTIGGKRGIHIWWRINAFK